MKRSWATLAVGIILASALPAQEEPGPAKPRVDLYGDPLPEGAVARLGTVRLRHHTMYGSLDAAFSPDGKRVVTGGSESLRIWDRATGKLIAQITDDYRQSRIVFSPDGKWLAASARGAVCIRDGESGRLIRKIDGPGYVYAVSPDGSLIAARIDGNAVGLWNTATGQEVARLEEQKEPVGDAAFTQDGRTLVSVCIGKRICRWQVPSGKLEKRMEVAVPLWRTFRLSPDARTLAYVPYSRDAVQLWDTETGKPRLKLQGDPSCSYYGLAFSADSKVLATNWSEEHSEDGLLSLWNTETGKPLRRFTLPVRQIGHIVFAPDGRSLLTSARSAVHLWDAHTGQAALHFDAHDGYASAIAFTPDGKVLVSSDYNEGLRVWDAQTSRHLRRIKGHRWGTYTFRLMPDGRMAISCGNDGALRLWDLDTGNEVRRFLINEEPEKLTESDYRVSLLEVAGNGRSAASYASRHKVGEPPLIHLWELANGKATVGKVDPAAPYPSLFSPDARVLVTRHYPPAPEVKSVEKTVPQPGRMRIVMQDVATGQTLLALTPPNQSMPFHAFSPDGRIFAGATLRLSLENDEYVYDAHTIHLWEVATGNELLTIAGPGTGQHPTYRQLAFSPNGRMLAAIRGNRTFEIWDVASGTELLQRGGYESGVSSLSFSPNGESLATGHEDSTILVWDLAPESWPRQPVAKADEKQKEAWWSALAGEDAKKAHVAIWAMVGSPEEAVPLLKERLTPAAGPPAEKLKQWLADLDSPQFARRETAAKELAGLEELAYPALEQALKANPSPEVRRRIEALLNVPRIVRSPETLRRLRAIEVLEQIGSAEAKQLLKRLAEGPGEARPTQEAKASLERLERRPGK